MKIIADSGSTKCTWLVTDGVHTSEYRTRGINAVQHSPEQIREALAELPPCGPVEAVYFYGAGCGGTFPEATEKMVRELRAHFGTGRIEAETDLLGAARALFGRGEGVACILGTGSNSCWCRGGEIVENVPPLGYVLGDEGSGAALGRNLVNGIFKGHIPLREEFLAAHGLTYEEIILRVYREPYANRFLASFAPFVHAYLDCPEVRAMVAETFADFAQRNLSRYPVHLTVACIGGVAAAFEGLLREVLAHGGYRVGLIAASPAEGLIRGGEIVENVPPLGYVLGDEGSGAALGRNLVNGIFKGHIPLREEFLAAHGLTYEEIILRVYREPYANRFLASFAPFVHAYLDCPEVRAMVAETFADFAQRNLSRYPVHLTVACIGGVAAAFEGLLREVLAHGGYRVGLIAASPAEGLIKYHYGK